MDSVAARSLAARLTGQTVAGWTVGTRLGHGKSAAVFAASRGTASAVLKIFDTDMVVAAGRERQLARLKREQDLIGHDHPNLVQVLATGYDDDQELYFVAMERVYGHVLSDVMDVVPRGEIRSLISQIAGAAKYLETRGFAHRDIKPDNVMVSDNISHATLMDLGVIRPMESSESVTDEGERRQFLGTLQYSPPELLFREAPDTVDAWRAITFYQLGATLYDLLERRRLFADKEPYGRMVEAVRQDVPQLTARDVPPDLVGLAQNCLLKNPSTRLECVTWDDFLRAGPTDELDSLRSAIAARQRSHAEASALSMLPDLCRQRIDAARHVLQQSVQRLPKHGVFPPQLVRIDNDGDVVTATVEFDARPDLGISRGLVLSFACRVVNVEEAVVVVSATRPAADSSITAPVDIYRGSIEGSGLPSSVEKFALGALHSASV